MNYSAWQQSIRERPRGRQRWASRVRVYEYVASEPAAVFGEVAALCEEAATAVSTFYACFGPGSPDRLTEADPMLVVLAETKAWSIHPYLTGALEAYALARPAPRTMTDALVRLGCEWAQYEPNLARTDAGDPPIPLLEAIGASIAEAGVTLDQGASDDLRDVVGAALRQAADEAGNDSSLAVLNTVRPQLSAILGEAGDAANPDAAVNVVEAITGYAEQLSASTDPADATLLSELTPMFERFLSMLPTGAK